MEVYAEKIIYHAAEQRLIFFFFSKQQLIPYLKPNIYILPVAWWQTHMHPPDRKQPSRHSVLRGKADGSLLYYYPSVFPFASPCMYKFPSAGNGSSVLYTENVYHWAVPDYFHTCLFYTIRIPTGLILRFYLSDWCVWKSAWGHRLLDSFIVSFGKGGRCIGD